MRALSSVRPAAAVLALALAEPAAAQASRTWVSGVGDDANPCSRTAPCKTFAGALSKTAAGGEIDALDPGDFGPLFITKSIAIDGGHALAGIQASGVPAVVVNAAASDVVVLRRLRLAGVAAPTTPPAGIVFGSGAELHVEATTITGFAIGIDFRPAEGGRLVAARVDVAGSADAGIAVASGDALTPARATLSDVHVTGGASHGLRVGDHGFATLARSLVAGATEAGIAAIPTYGGDADVNLQDVVLSGNAVGLAAQTAGPGRATVRLSRLTSLDATVPAVVGLNGDIRSFGDNRLLSGVDFDVSVAPPTAQVKRGTSATFTVSTTAVGISPGAVALACEGLPAHARCAFTPSTLSPSGTAATSTLTLFTDGSIAPAAAAIAAGLGAPSSGSRGGPPAWPLLAVLAAVAAALRWRGRGRLRPTLAAGACALGLFAGCNGGGSGSHDVASGLYTVTVKATAGLVSHQATLSLEVQD